MAADKRCPPSPTDPFDAGDEHDLREVRHRDRKFSSPELRSRAKPRFTGHKLLAALCYRSDRLRLLVRDGQLLAATLRAEGMSVAELPAGLRKLGPDSLESVELVTLEENGVISAVDMRRER